MTKNLKINDRIADSAQDAPTACSKATFNRAPRLSALISSRAGLVSLSFEPWLGSSAG